MNIRATIFYMNEENEIWKDIAGYEGLYQVSNLGRVRSVERVVLMKDGKYRKTYPFIRKQRVKNNGYYQVNLSKYGSIRWFSVHRLVAQAFIPNPNNYTHINHKDENKDNNIVENLEWCTHHYNCMYGTGRERQKISRMNNPNDRVVRMLVGEKNSKPVFQYSTDFEFIASYKSATQASKLTGVSVSTILRHCNHSDEIGNNPKRPIRKYIFRYEKI